jgi:hypothetical protein
MARGIPSQTEVPVPFFLRGVCVGHGRADVLTRTHVVELKAVKPTPAQLRACRQQLRRYIVAIRQVLSSALSLAPSLALSLAALTWWPSWK